MLVSSEYPSSLSTEDFGEEFLFKRDSSSNIEPFSKKFNIKIDVGVMFDILEPKVFSGILDASLEIENHVKDTIIRLTTNDFASLNILLANRDDLSFKTQEAVEHKTMSWGIKVIGVAILGILPPQEIQDDMSRIMMAERQARSKAK